MFTNTVVCPITFFLCDRKGAKLVRSHHPRKWVGLKPPPNKDNVKLPQQQMPNCSAQEARFTATIFMHDDDEDDDDEDDDEVKKAAKDQDLRGYSKLTKAELIARLSARNNEDDDVWKDARGDARADDVWEDARDDARAEPTQKGYLIGLLDL
ncbi:hypothetical protein DPMN_086100 [Dreissena polymorpha]|uniref:Rho termination factor N-terminal domain-containing protein n=1 Tax=Dreissena polymorpha TaxID=45954 RepID=A0A9D3YH87_DREPO|nr:hypothetical protein DPMN_086100 [Dreissena polymorpha]